MRQFYLLCCFGDIDVTFVAIIEAVDKIERTAFGQSPANAETGTHIGQVLSVRIRPRSRVDIVRRCNQGILQLAGRKQLDRLIRERIIDLQTVSET